MPAVGRDAPGRAFLPDEHEKKGVPGEADAPGGGREEVAFGPWPSRLRAPASWPGFDGTSARTPAPSRRRLPWRAGSAFPSRPCRKCSPGARNDPRLASCWSLHAICSACRWMRFCSASHRSSSCSGNSAVGFRPGKNRTGGSPFRREDLEGRWGAPRGPRRASNESSAGAFGFHVGSCVRASPGRAPRDAGAVAKPRVVPRLGRCSTPERSYRRPTFQRLREGRHRVLALEPGEHVLAGGRLGELEVDVSLVSAAPDAPDVVLVGEK